MKLKWTKKTHHTIIKSVQERFSQAVDQDFNFAAGLAILFDLAKELRREANLLIHEGKTSLPQQELRDKWHTLVHLAEVLGLSANFESQQQSTPDDSLLSDAEIEELIEQRKIARQAKNYAESDRLRDLLKEQGITLIDASGGVTKWHR